jgi:hypothetical protein
VTSTPTIREIGVGRNYLLALPLGEAIAQHRAWASSQMIEISRVEVGEPGKVPGFVLLIAFGPTTDIEAAWLDTFFEVDA